MGINYCFIVIYKKGDLLKMKVIYDMDFFLIYMLLCLNIQLKLIKFEYIRCFFKKLCKLKLFDFFEWFFFFNLLQFKMINKDRYINRDKC